MATAQVARAPRQASLSQAPRAGLGGALRSEFTKLWSLRSTYWTLLTLAVMTVGIGVLASSGTVHSKGATPASVDATQVSLAGLYVGQLVMAVLGALTITSEYSTGMIRTSLVVQPRRGIVFTAKAAVFGAVAFVTGLIISFGSFFTGQAIMSGHRHLNATLGQPNVLRAVIGGALFLTVCGMLAYGLGAIIRSTAGAITTAVGLLFVVPILASQMPQSWQDAIDKWLPSVAGSMIWVTKVSGDSQEFSAWTGFALFTAYAAVAAAVGYILFRKRDA
jgi:ABC-2 type transport system permease protein